MGSTSLALKYTRDSLGSLRRLELFAELPDDALGQIDRTTAWLTISPGEAIERMPSAIGERYLFVVEGQLAIAVERGARAKTENAEEGGRPTWFKNRRDREIRYVACLEAGDFLSDAYLPDQGTGTGEHVECLGLVASVLAAVPLSTIAKLARTQPAWSRAMNAKNAALRERHRDHAFADLRVVQDFFLRYGYSFATTLKVIDLDACIDCNACEDACGSRHGAPRLDRHGPILGRLAFPHACRTCVDHRCVSACGFDAIAYTDEQEVRVDKVKCVGCTACQAACPNDVIKMVKVPYTAADFPNPMPDTSLEGETNVPGLYLVGEASGDALIKVAINSGKKAIDKIARELAAEARSKVPGVHDVIIAGSGPSGLSAGLTAMAAGLDYVVLEKGNLASTIQSYPRHKVVMAEPAHIPLYGDLWLRDTTKEELIEKWTDVVAKTGLVITSNHEVKTVRKDERGFFAVETSHGTFHARRVVLAVGKRGSPRKLGVAGEAHPRVRYVLTDAEEHAHHKALVVGGGDSAVEAAIALAEAPGTTVTLSYRRDSFGRIKVRNKERLAECESSGRLRVILESNVRRLEAGVAVLAVKDGSEERIPNDVVFALLGAEPPVKLFESSGIRIIEPTSIDMVRFAESRGDRHYASKCDHCAGHSDQACISACPTGAIIEVAPNELFIAKTGFDVAPFVLGVKGGNKSELSRWAAAAAVFSLVLTAAIGIECFQLATLSEVSVLRTLLHAKDAVVFASGSGFGFYLGIVGSVMMALTALYPFVPKLPLLSRFTRTRLWFTAHISAGIIGPALVTYHTTLKLDRWPAIAFWVMWGVVLSGGIGRYVCTYFREASGLDQMAAEARDKGASWRARLARLIERSLAPWKRVHLVLTVLLFVIGGAHIVFAMLFKAT